MMVCVNPQDGSYIVKVKVFEGPLDLLLHLIRINKLDIYDIPIVEITDQYNKYLDLMKEMSFDIAGEFIVMASTLMYIKSKMLLPVEQMNMEESGEDPRAELTRQLIDYQKYKAASENLTALQDIQSLIWLRDSSEDLFLEGNEIIEASIFDLVKAFEGILERVEARKGMEVSREEYSVQEKMRLIIALLENQRFLEFEKLFSHTAARGEKIAVFLAILELIRLRMIRAFQRSIEESIKIFKTNHRMETVVTPHEKRS